MSGEAAVRIQEIDLTSRVATFEGVFGAITVQAKKGDTSRPSLVVNNRQFLDRYTPKGRVEVGYDLAHYSALSYLSRSDKLWVSRAINEALFGGAAIKRSDANTPNNPLRDGFDNPDAYVFDSQLDIVGQPEVSNVVANSNVAISAVQAQFLLQTVADTSGSLDGTYFVLPENGTDTVAFWFNISGSTVEPSHGATRSVEITTVSQNDSAQDVASALNALVDGDSAFESSVDGNELLIQLAFAGEVSDPSMGTSGFSFSTEEEGADATFSLQEKAFIIYDATGSVGVWFNVGGQGSLPTTISGTTRQIEVSLTGALSADDVAIELRDAMQADVAFSATLLGNTVTITDAQDGARDDISDVNTSFSFEVIQQGQTETDEDDEALLLYASSEGAWVNDIGVRITTHLDDADLVPEEDSFLIEVYRREFPGQPVEEHFCSRILGKKDGFGRNMYVEDVLKSSSYIRALNNDLVDDNIYPLSQSDILFLGAGDDGLSPSTSDMIGAANQFSNPEDISVTLLMDGGYAVPAYQSALNTIAQNRMDCVAILSTPISAELSANYLNDVIDYRKSDLNLNSSYAALYTPHVEIRDQFNDRDIFVSPDGFVAASISFNANAREIWQPPAGYRRGVLEVQGVSRVFESGERSALYNVGINPIKSTPGRGIVIWGQKTLLARPSLLNRMNVRLLLIVISPAMKEFLEDYLFEINDRITRAEVEEKISEYLRDIQGRRGIERFQVICDESNNPPQVVENNRMICDVLLTPTSSAEDIPLRVVLVSGDTSFGDAAQAV